MALGNNPTQQEVVKAIKDLESAGGSATDVQINSTSITSGGVANIVTNSAYNASSNKIATMGDLPTNKAAASGGNDDSLVTTGDKYTWNNKQSALSSQTAYSAKGTTTKVPQITTNTLGQVTLIEEKNIAFPVTSVNGETGDITGLATSNPNLLINSNFAINQRAGYYAPSGIDVYSTSAVTNALAKLETPIQTQLVSGTVRKASGCTIRETHTSTSFTLWQYPTPNQKSSITLYVNGTATTNFGYDTSTKTISAIIPTGFVYEAVYTASTNGTTPSEMFFKTSDCVSGYIGAIYGVDRWKSISGLNIVDINSDGTITFKSGYSTNTYLKQPIEGNFAGLTLTASVKIKTITSGSAMLRAYHSTNASSWTSIDGKSITATGITNLTFTVPSSAKYISLDIGASNYGVITFEWVKLEVGEIATEYTPPLIAEELQKCGYYHRRLGKNGSQNQYGDAYAYNTTTLWLSIAEVLSLMRESVNPTINCDNISNLRCVTNTGVGSGLTPTAIAFGSGGIVLTVSGATAYARYRIIDASSSASGIIHIDKEI